VVREAAAAAERDRQIIRIALELPIRGRGDGSLRAGGHQVASERSTGHKYQQTRHGNASRKELK